MSLLRRLTRSLSSASAPRFDAPLAPEAPFFVIGDIHGRDDLLSRLLEQIETEDAGRGLPIVCVGDYVDRGEESAAVLRRVHGLEREAGGRVVCLLGNHEEMMLSFLDDPQEKGPRWLRYGGLQTLASFRIEGISQNMNGERLAGARAGLERALGDDLIGWLRARPLTWTSGNVSVVHAAADPETPLDAQARKTLLWGHRAFFDTPRKDGRWIVHGHTISDEVTMTGGRIGVDTGAYATGRLSAALITPGGIKVLN